MLTAQKAREIKATGSSDWYKTVSSLIRNAALKGETEVHVNGAIFGTTDNSSRTALKNELESLGFHVTPDPDWTHTLAEVVIHWAIVKAADLTDLSAFALTADLTDYVLTTDLTTILEDYSTTAEADALYEPIA